MKHVLKSAVRKVSRVISRDKMFRRAPGDSFDILDVAFFNAAIESARFYEEFMLMANAYETGLSLLTHALGMAPKEGLLLEFGVATGRTIRHMASLTTRRLHGFDSFDGLPENWRT